MVLLVVVALLLPPLPAQAAAPAGGRLGKDGWTARQVSKGRVLERDRPLLKGLPSEARLGYHPETKQVRFLSGTRARPLGGAIASVASGKRALSLADARSRARRFVDRYGALFGVASPGRELRVSQSRRQTLALASLAPGNVASASGPVASASGPVPFSVTVRFDQVRAGLPVMGGQIVVQVSERGEVLSAAGEVLPSDATVATKPRIQAGQARTIAATWLAREAGRPPAEVVTRSEGLALYDPRVMGDPSLASIGARPVWRIDAQLSARGRQAAQHRLVIVDALGGEVLTSIGRIYSIDRIICDNQGSPGRAFRCSPPFARQEGQANTGISDVDALYRLMGVVDDFLASRFGRSSLDGKGARLKATVRYCSASRCPWQGAEWKWAEQQAIFGAGWAQADDIVGHEFAHGLLDHTVPLFYFYQSGAINESFADIFGELIDLSQPGGRDTAATAWKIGEDTPIGAFRDMRDPTRFGHPDRVRSPRWHKGTADDGGVHRNSGVGNKAAYLIADGGSFRGYDIAGIGRTRMGRVFYQALTTRLTPAANYVDLADALVAACTDLVGIDGFTLAHCASVRDATLATQMHLEPRQLAPRQAPLCPTGKRPIDVFADDLEDPTAGNWKTQRLSRGKKGWYYPQNPNDSPAWDGTWASSGKYNFYAPNYGRKSDTVMRTTSPYLIPEGAFLRFEHGYSFDRDTRRRYDGGIVEVMVGGGPWRPVKALFTHGGYNGRIAAGYGNTLAGQRAFTGNSHGWSSARVDLSRFAGQWLKVRFRMASDRAVGARGWYIDDIRIYTCADDADKPFGTLTINGGDAATTAAGVSLALTYGDATTWVTHLSISGSPELDGQGRLLRSLRMPIRDTLPWDLRDTSLGGDGLPGPKTIYAQVRDAAGNWSEVFADDIELLAAP